MAVGVEQSPWRSSIQDHAARRGGWLTDRHANYPTTDIAVSSMDNATRRALEAVAAGALPYLRDFYLGGDGGATLELRDLFVVKYDGDAQRRLRRHRDGCELSFGVALASSEAKPFTGQQKRAKFPTSKAPFSAGFNSFRLIFGRAIIFWNGLEAWALFLERARAKHSS